MTDSMSKLALSISAVSGFAYLIVYVRTRKRVSSYVAEELKFYDSTSGESEEELQAFQNEYHAMSLIPQYMMILLAMSAIIFGLMGVFGHSTE
ncbi:hypothetical protein DFQ01_11694 [Paenibacillus cellulosilyticus]|uniref:Uncharacterized protein n=1 Tax=Paenibacillus cellulosilyticus TaxID=375489 RepID=A0A2V2YRN3_9BACL|nr:hypothetical protein [Paenibacillus cellulosilyticus]PWV98695.1 hypothetical protein DFQ01_11694 [Paenibacillus cellulosilyticus]QKS43803.1 hypothetical protein HUB94_04650 [Paenibacillus cellulosilyticus]